MIVAPSAHCGYRHAGPRDSQQDSITAAATAWTTIGFVLFLVSLGTTLRASPTSRIPAFVRPDTHGPAPPCSAVSVLA